MPASNRKMAESIRTLMVYRGYALPNWKYCVHAVTARIITAIATQTKHGLFAQNGTYTVTR